MVYGTSIYNTRNKESLSLSWLWTQYPRKFLNCLAWDGLLFCKWMVYCSGCTSVWDAFASANTWVLHPGNSDSIGLGGVWTSLIIIASYKIILMSNKAWEHTASDSFSPSWKQFVGVVAGTYLVPGSILSANKAVDRTDKACSWNSHSTG